MCLSMSLSLTHFCNQHPIQYHHPSATNHPEASHWELHEFTACTAGGCARAPHPKDELQIKAAFGDGSLRLRQGDWVMCVWMRWDLDLRLFGQRRSLGRGVRLRLLPGQTGRCTFNVFMNVWPCLNECSFIFVAAGACSMLKLVQDCSTFLPAQCLFEITFTCSQWRDIGKYVCLLLLFKRNDCNIDPFHTDTEHTGGINSFNEDCISFSWARPRALLLCIFTHWHGVTEGTSATSLWSVSDNKPKLTYCAVSA